MFWLVTQGLAPVGPEKVRVLRDQPAGCGTGSRQKQAVTGLWQGAGVGGQDHPGGSLGRWAARVPKATSTVVTLSTALPGWLLEHWLLPASTTGAETPPHKSQDLPWIWEGPGHLPWEILAC